MLCDRKAFMSPESSPKVLKYSWQTTPCTSTTTVTLSTKSMFSFRLSLRVDPLSPMVSSQSFQLDPPFSSGTKYCMK